MEALKHLLHAACASSVPVGVHYALGNLHYLWGELLEHGRRAELGGEGAARSVAAEIKDLRRGALKRRAEAGGTVRRRRSTFSTNPRVESDATQPKQVATEPDGCTSAMDADRPIVDHAEAWKWYEKAAEHGDSRAMLRLGDIALESTKDERSKELAKKWYLRAAKGEPPQPDALFQLARMEHEGIGMLPNPARAKNLYEQSCAAGSSAAAFLLGQRFHVGDSELDIKKDARRAMSLLHKASDQNHAEATFYLAQLYRSGSNDLELRRDLQKFGALVQQAAGAGSEDAMFALGGVYFHGEDGFERDPRAAFRHYSSAAEAGHPDASYCLGVMYYTMGDFHSAFNCYQTAAEGGNTRAWKSLASMYALGEGVAQSDRMAKHILTALGDRIDRADDKN